MLRSALQRISATCLHENNNRTGVVASHQIVFFKGLTLDSIISTLCEIVQKHTCFHLYNNCNETDYPKARHRTFTKLNLMAKYVRIDDQIFVKEVEFWCNLEVMAS